MLLRAFDHPALAGAVDIIVFHRRRAPVVRPAETALTRWYWAILLIQAVINITRTGAVCITG